MVHPSERPECIAVEVVYALPHHQFLKRIEVIAGTSLAKAIMLSGVTELYPEINCMVHKTGIFGKIVTVDTILQQNDRIEIYRPLTIDPKEKRRLRSENLKKKLRD
jgi:putative ubiquitin-RnfH superfamily antitoxin RatB of RatAB toxin-antitoxin module